MQNNRESQVNKSSFDCPHCLVYANQIWAFVFAKENQHSSAAGQKIENTRVAFCTHCQDYE